MSTIGGILIAVVGLIFVALGTAIAGNALREF